MASQLQWKVEVSWKDLLNDFHMASMCMVPAKFYKVQCKLAKNFKYLDYSLTLATAANVIGEDGKM